MVKLIKTSVFSRVFVFFGGFRHGFISFGIICRDKSKNARFLSKRSKNARAFQISQFHGTYRTTLSRYLPETRPVDTGQAQNARNKLMTASFKTHDPWFPKKSKSLIGSTLSPSRRSKRSRQHHNRGHDMAFDEY